MMECKHEWPVFNGGPYGRCLRCGETRHSEKEMEEASARARRVLTSRGSDVDKICGHFMTEDNFAAGSSEEDGPYIAYMPNGTDSPETFRYCTAEVRHADAGEWERATSRIDYQLRHNRLTWRPSILDLPPNCPSCKKLHSAWKPGSLMTFLCECGQLVGKDNEGVWQILPNLAAPDKESAFTREYSCLPAPALDMAAWQDWINNEMVKAVGVRGEGTHTSMPVSSESFEDLSFDWHSEAKEPCKHATRECMGTDHLTCLECGAVRLPPSEHWHADIRDARREFRPGTPQNPAQLPPDWPPIRTIKPECEPTDAELFARSSQTLMPSGDGSVRDDWVEPDTTPTLTPDYEGWGMVERGPVVCPECRGGCTVLEPVRDIAWEGLREMVVRCGTCDGEGEVANG